MTMSQNRIEIEINHLQDQITLLRGAIELLATSCACSVAERESGHLVECAAPAVMEIVREMGDK